MPQIIISKGECERVLSAIE